MKSETRDIHTTMTASLPFGTSVYSFYPYSAREKGAGIQLISLDYRPTTNASIGISTPVSLTTASPVTLRSPIMLGDSYGFKKDDIAESTNYLAILQEHLP